MCWILFFAMPFVCIGPVSQNDAEYCDSAKQSLAEFEQWYWGLAFEGEDVTSPADKERIWRRMWYWASADGQFHRLKVIDVTKHGTHGHETYSNNEKGYSVSNQYSLSTRDDGEIVISDNVDYSTDLPEGERRAEGGGGSLLSNMGFISGLTFTQYFEASVVARVHRKLKGKSYDGILADHERHGRVEFLFDDDMNLIWIHHTMDPGDYIYFFPTNGMNSPGFVDLMGPFEYEMFAERRVVRRVTYERVNMTTMNSMFKGPLGFVNFARTDVDDRIEFSENVKIKEGQPLHNEGRPYGTYLIKNGHVALAVDSVAIDGTRNARYFGSSSLHYWFGLAILFATILCFMVWYRNRDGS